MRLLRIGIVLLCLAMVAVALPVAAEPLAQGCEGLVNSGFEDGFSERGAGEVAVANGWNPWWQDGPFQQDGFYRRPEFKQEDIFRFGNRRIHSGSNAAKFFTTYSTHNAGFWQQVNVPAGSTCTFAIWVQVWSSQDPDPGAVLQPGNYRVYVGIDPTGGTDGLAPSVVWSEPRIEYNTWIQLSVSAVAAAGKITVFTRGNPEFRNRFNDSYWDDACLTIVRPAPTSTPIPPATNTPVATATPTNSPAPTATSTPVPASICVQVYDDPNQNKSQDTGEQLLAKAELQLLNEQGQVLETYTTEARTDPYCFVVRQAGIYYLREKNPTGYLSVSPDDWGISITPGGKVHIRFWDYLPPTPTATNTIAPTNTPTPSPSPTVVSTPTVKPTEQPVASSDDNISKGVYSVIGIILAILGVMLIVGVRMLHSRL
jgi:hypothetical protein